MKLNTKTVNVVVERVGNMSWPSDWFYLIQYKDDNTMHWRTWGKVKRKEEIHKQFMQMLSYKSNAEVRVAKAFDVDKDDRERGERVSEIIQYFDMRGK